MFEFLKTVIPYLTPIFVISTMLNVGLTQKFSEIVEHLKSGSFVLRMLVAKRLRRDHKMKAETV